MSAPMVHAILAGSKTVTRRVVKAVRGDNTLLLRKATKTKCGIVTHVMDAPGKGLCPYGEVGDRLWVRETCRVTTYFRSARRAEVRYEADGTYGVVPIPERLKPIAPGKCIANGCYREAARLWLEITTVRVERLQDIREADAIAEGLIRDRDGFRGAADLAWYASPIAAYRSLWERINGAGSWDANPWVWAIEFKRVTP
jgi:hypothetical protein